MPFPFLLLVEWDAATRGAPSMPGLALLLEEAEPEADEEGEPHPMECACPDCSDDSPILED